MSMALSYNGWPASRNAADFGGLDNRVVPGTTVKLAPGVRAGDVAIVAFFTAWMWNTHIEKLFSPGCWGHTWKNSANSKALLSCHSSGTAWDICAPRHPNGKRGTLTVAQVAVLRLILSYCDGVVYWGGDAWGNGTPDEMHLEITSGKTVADVAAVASKILALYGPMESWPAVAPLPGVGYGGAPAPAPRPAPVKVAAERLSPDPRTVPLSFQRWYNAFNFQPELPVIRPTANAWGPQSDAALRRVQGRYGLAVDGVPGPKTRALLYRLGWRG